MKINPLRIMLLALILVLGLSQGCLLDSQDECKDTEADAINVNIKIIGHNMVRNDPNIKIEIEKQPCGEATKGQIDLSGAADQFGDFESIIANYNLANENDQINIGYDFDVSIYHGGEAQFGSLVLKYEDLKAYNGKTFELDMEYYPPMVNTLWKAWKQNPSTMGYCYDLPYFLLFGTPPPEDQNPAVTKSSLYEKMVQLKYQKRDEGQLNSSVYLQDGDIILFGTTALPNPSDAQHYAIVLGDAIWEIVHWNQGGQFDGPRDMGFFLNRPKMQNPYSGNEEDPLVPYLYYRIYNKS